MLWLGCFLVAFFLFCFVFLSSLCNPIIFCPAYSRQRLSLFCSLSLHLTNYLLCRFSSVDLVSWVPDRPTQTVLAMSISWSVGPPLPCLAVPEHLSPLKLRAWSVWNWSLCMVRDKDEVHLVCRHGVFLVLFLNRQAFFPEIVLASLLEVRAVVV